VCVCVCAVLYISRPAPLARVRPSVITLLINAKGKSDRPDYSRLLTLGPSVDDGAKALWVD